MDVEYDDVRNAVESIELSIDDLYLEYSGRAMFGAKCLGFVGTLGDAIHFVVALAEVLDDGDLSWVQDARSDQMGRSMIYYWPSIRVINIPSFDEDDAS
jgi:hypothetical protein